MSRTVATQARGRQLEDEHDAGRRGRAGLAIAAQCVLSAPDCGTDVDVLVCPPFPYLLPVG